MNPDEVLRTLRCLGQPGDRQRGGVAGEDRRGRYHRFGARRHIRLDPAVFEYRLDHQVATVEIGIIVRRFNQAKHGLRLLRRRFAAADGLVEQCARIGLAPVGRLDGCIEQADLHPGPRRDVGDPGAHHPGTEHSQFADGGLRDSSGPPGQLVRLALVNEQRPHHVAGNDAGHQLGEIFRLDAQPRIERRDGAFVHRRHNGLGGGIVVECLAREQ